MQKQALERDCIYDQFLVASQSPYWLKANAPPFKVPKFEH
jgi:hypothetical protein